MTDEQRYLFDLHGFLMIEDVLTPDEVRKMNELIDGYDIWNNLGTPPFDEAWLNGDHYCTVGPLHQWDKPFRDLLDHATILPCLTEIVGSKFRFDVGHALFMRKGGDHLLLHGGGAPYIQDSSFEFHEGKFFNGLIKVSYALVDMPKGQFVAVPGSHKANYPVPPEYLHFDKVPPCIQRVPQKAGSAVIFTEALTHGTWPWEEDYERRSLLYAYCPGHMAWGGMPANGRTYTYPTVEDDPDYDWTPEQRRMLVGPWTSHPGAGRPDIVEVG